MISPCTENLPNPHRNCIREIMKSLVCYENDFQLINAHLRKLQHDFKEEMEKLTFGNSKINNRGCELEDKAYFTENITTIHELNECFTKKFEELRKKQEEIITMSRQCISDLNTKKCKMRQFHEKTVDYLKRYAIKSDDPTVINNCEKDICELHRLFVKEVSLIKRCETELQSFFQLCGLKDIGDCSCFKHYDWIPEGKNLHAVDEVFNQIKCVMGTTIIKAFASLHVQQPTDLKSFLASYLMNLEHNENVLAEKLNLFGNMS
ncbi:uncharacterized protein [Eurosta solidaginis]|uniref:uncharacterized protein n=1 Tax=Eurosta solidaginis TaxID=178769 RepID=UPI003530D59B